jgi:hypothetical protein
MSNASHGGAKASSDVGTQRAIMKNLPKKITDYMLYDCPLKLDVAEIIKLMNKRRDLNTDEFLAWIKKGVAQSTKAMYGPDHPGVKESVLLEQYLED